MSTKGQITRATIVGEALNQAIDLGLEGISLGGVASSLGLSKSGLFAHFKSKEVLQLAVLDEAIERFTRAVVLPSQAEASGLAKIEALFRGSLDWIAGSAETRGCLFVTMIQEYDDRPGPIRDRLVSSQAGWRALLAAVISQAVGEGELRSDVDPAQIAFEFAGLTTAFHQSLRLFHDPSAHARALAGFRRLIDSHRP